MIKESKIEALSNEIRMALPYLMEISEGCIFFNQKRGYFKAHYVKKIDDSNLLKTHIVAGVLEGNNNASYYYPMSVELIGKEPMLNDVLAWVQLLDFTSYYDDVKYSHKGFTSDTISFYYKWNLEKQYLKDQSDELINFLYSLIEKK